LHTEVADIKKEVTFNSGGSMKDAVSRTEQQVVQNNLDLKEQTKNLTGQIRAVKTETAKATKHAKKNSQRITVLEKKS
jgi:DNA-binding helix-hairpin-helix protein with protein kinase domain